VTGAAGFLGLATTSALARQTGTEHVVALDVRPCEFEGPTMPAVSARRDIRAPLGGLLREFDVEAVIHLAYMLQAGRNAAAARAVNVDGTARLLEACTEAGVRQIIYLSSTTVYGAHAAYTRPFVETDPVRPVRGFSYSEQKVEAERLVEAYAASHPEARVCILRGCVIMAPGADNFISRALGRRTLPAPAGADPEMQFLHVDDYLSALRAAVRTGARGTYNIAGQGAVRWREVAAMTGARLVPVPSALLAAAVDSTWRLRLQSESGANGLNFIRFPWLASTEKIRAELGWSPAHTSREAVESWARERRKTR
jgi:UDP-glucose 4-epimerase